MKNADDFNTFANDGIAVLDTSGSVGMPRGTIDPDKLKAASERLMQLLEEQQQERQERLKKLADTTSQLQNAVQAAINVMNGPTPEELLNAQKEAEREDQRRIAEAEVAKVFKTAAIAAAVISPLGQDTAAPAKAQFRKPAMKKFTS
jgi:hypothetical protein